MTRVLVLGESGLVVPDEAVEAVEAIESLPDSGPDRDDDTRPWLPGLLTNEPRPAASGRRALRLRGGGRVEVPAAMSIAEVEVLALPALLQTIAASCGVIGITTLADRLGLVCDPRLLPLAREGGRAP